MKLYFVCRCSAIIDLFLFNPNPIRSRSNLIDEGFDRNTHAHTHCILPGISKNRGRVLINVNIGGVPDFNIVLINVNIVLINVNISWLFDVFFFQLFRIQIPSYCVFPTSRCFRESVLGVYPYRRLVSLVKIVAGLGTLQVVHLMPIAPLSWVGFHMYRTKSQTFSKGPISFAWWGLSFCLGDFV